jgi:hypothetical protein
MCQQPRTQSGEVSTVVNRLNASIQRVSAFVGNTAHIHLSYILGTFFAQSYGTRTRSFRRTSLTRY